MSFRPRYCKWLLLLLSALLLTACGSGGAEQENPDDDYVYMIVSPNKLTFNTANGAKNSITVSSNSSWTAEVSNNGLMLDKMSGTAGEQTVTVTAIPEGETYKATFTTTRTDVSGNKVSKILTVSRSSGGIDPGPSDGEVVFSDNLDKATYSGSGNPYLDEWDGFINATGIGVTAGSITYTGSNVSIRNNFISQGYGGASGGNSLYFGSSTAYCEISGITLPEGQTSYALSFGACGYQTFPSGALTVKVSADGGSFTELTYSRGTSASWELSSIPFIFSSAPANLSLCFEGDTYICVDDIKLVTSSETGSQVIEVGNTVYGYPWAEIPGHNFAANRYKVVTHFASTVRSQKYVRNFTSCYDTEYHNPLYVAFADHEIYREGGFGRTNPDPWSKDPLLEESEQSIIYGSDYAGWPWAGNSNKSTDSYQYWGSLSKPMSVHRGHMLASNARGGAGSLLNKQTFYPSNISPQALKYDSQHWAPIELAPDKWYCSDTLYIVVGCWYDRNNAITAYDACSGNSLSTKSKRVVIPNARYKLFLRTKAGNSRKPVVECDADELQTIGFWFDQNMTGETITTTPPLSEYTFSVADIEKMTGGELNFFPTIDPKVKDTYKVSDWEGLAQISD